MSLSKLADEQTADLMRDYYQRLLAGEGRSEPFIDDFTEMSISFDAPEIGILSINL